MFNDSLGFTDHDRYYKDPRVRDLYYDSDVFKKVEAALLLENPDVFEKIQEVLNEIKTAEINHEKRGRVHDWNNIALKLSGSSELLEISGFKKGTFKDLKSRKDLKNTYSIIVRALANYYRERI